ncbi:MAG: Sensor histidine kinase CusS [Candidatus Udaeobacter sp.]|nr:MAG: Sensor histidine kinase CusS [Candidatus Udaeobacter sp.]
MRTAFWNRGQLAFRCARRCGTRAGRAEAIRCARGSGKIAAFYETIAEDRHVAINCSGQYDFCRPALFERAVGNLVDNALRFTPENGSIQIALAERAKDFEVAVSDNGSGIASEHLPRVFDRFYRAESSRGSDGAGLGLALVKSIVDLHGAPPGFKAKPVGATVSITFPKGA